MELSPELEKSIKDALSAFMGEDEAEHYMNFDYATSLVKQLQPPWQALVSVGVHVAEAYAHQETNDEKLILHELVGQALRPVETLFASLLRKSGEELLESEQARLLFHTRFGLGFLLLAKGDKTRSKGILHDMAATKVSVRGHSYYGEGPGILSCTNDVRQGKLRVAFDLLPEYARQKDCVEILYLVTEALACAPWATYILDILPVIIDYCVTEYEKEDYDGPGLEWLHLFVEAAELLSLCEEYDSSGSAPNECKEESPQYLAWKIGQIAGRLAARWPDDPFGEFQDFKSAIEEDFQFERGEEKTRQTLMAILALLREYDPGRDWQKMRDQCLSIWRLSDIYSGMPLSEIGPCQDLYWAMRIGFADALMKHPAPLLGTKDVDSTVESKMWSQIADIMAHKEVQPLAREREEVLKLVESEESTVLEFKASARWDYRQNRLNDSMCLPVVRTVAAFLNTEGGRLLIGVGDNHEILGLSHDYQGFRKERDEYMQFIVNRVCNHIGEVECTRFVSVEFYKIDNEDICLLDVRRSDREVWFREGGKEESLYVRTQNETRKLSPSQAIDYIERTFPRRFNRN